MSSLLCLFNYPLGARFSHEERIGTVSNQCVLLRVSPLLSRLWVQVRVYRDAAEVLIPFPSGCRQKQVAFNASSLQRENGGKVRQI